MEIKKTDDNDFATIYSITLSTVASLEEVQSKDSFKELVNGKTFEADYDNDDPNLVWVTIMK